MTFRLLIAPILLFTTSAFALDGQVNIHDPSTVGQRSVALTLDESATPPNSQEPAAGTGSAGQNPPAAPGRGRGGRGGVEDSVVSGVISPQVSDDHRITFRLAAPNAKQVQVRGDF